MPVVDVERAVPDRGLGRGGPLEAAGDHLALLARAVGVDPQRPVEQLKAHRDIGLDAIDLGLAAVDQEAGLGNRAYGIGRQAAVALVPQDIAFPLVVPAAWSDATTVHGRRGN